MSTLPNAAPGLVGDLAPGRFERLRGARDDGDVCAFERKLAGDGLPDATTSARHDGNLACELEIHLRPP